MLGAEAPAFETYGKGAGVERIEGWHAISYDEPMNVELQLHQQLFVEGVGECRWSQKPRTGGSRLARATSVKSTSCSSVSKLGNRIRRRPAPPASGQSGRARSAVDLAYGQHVRQPNFQVCAAPTVSAILAARLPIGFGCPVVLSQTV
jgi:hypothetical protein